MNIKEIYISANHKNIKAKVPISVYHKLYLIDISQSNVKMLSKSGCLNLYSDGWLYKEREKRETQKQPRHCKRQQLLTNNYTDQPIMKAFVSIII